METTNRRHDIKEWTQGFRELLEGKALDVRRDLGFQVGDLLVYHEYIDGHCTGREVLFYVNWIARGADHNGAFEALIPPTVAVLGLAPANLVINQAEELPRAITVELAPMQEPSASVSIPLVQRKGASGDA